MPYVMPSANKEKPEPHCPSGNANSGLRITFVGTDRRCGFIQHAVNKLVAVFSAEGFASSIVSLMATLYGTSSRLDSSNSAIRNTAFSTRPSSSSRRDRYGFIRPSRYALLVATPDSSSRKYRTSTSFTSCSDGTGIQHQRCRSGTTAE